MEEGVERETTDDEGVFKEGEDGTVDSCGGQRQKKTEEWMKVCAWERLEVQIERTGGYA